MSAALVAIAWLATGAMPVQAAETKNATADAHPAKAVKPPSREAVESAITRGVDFLLKNQNRGDSPDVDGSWGSATQTKGLNIYAPVPGAHHAFRAAVTALCVSALIDSGDQRPEVAAAIDRGEAWLLANLSKVRRGDITALYNNWTHAYGIEAMVRLHERRKDDSARQQKIREVIVHQVDRLNRYRYGSGGWGYYDFDSHLQHPGEHVPSFTTATVLLALKDAQNLGVEVPDAMVTSGIRAVKRQQKPDFTYYYSGNFWMAPMRPINQPGGSLGRTQVCNLALRRWGDEKITDAVVEECLDRLFDRNLWLDIGRKRPIPHESYFQVAGYFYYYGHYYAAQCIDELPAEKRPALQARLTERLLPLQEKDGSWWDFPLYNYHQQYGTAMAVMSLARCRPQEK